MPIEAELKTFYKLEVYSDTCLSQQPKDCPRGMASLHCISLRHACAVFWLPEECRLAFRWSLCSGPAKGWCLDQKSIIDPGPSLSFLASFAAFFWSFFSFFLAFFSCSAWSYSAKKGGKGASCSQPAKSCQAVGLLLLFFLFLLILFLLLVAWWRGTRRWVFSFCFPFAQQILTSAVSVHY